MRIIGKLVFVFFISVSTGAFAATINITQPTTGNTNIDTALASALAAIETKLNTNYFSKIQDQNEMARGFANSNAATVHNASLMGYQNYDLFAVMVGTQYAVSVPGYSMSKSADALKKTTTKGDTYVGFAQSPVVANVGLNCKPLMDGLYLSLKFGGFNYSQTFNDIDVDYSQKTFGVGVNYSLLDGINIVAGLLRWRGFSFGTGVLYTQSDTKLTLSNIPDQTQSFTADSTTYSADVYDIKVKYNVKSNAVVVPLDLSTSIQALWILNVGVGAGADIVFPKSKITTGGDAKIGIKNYTGTIATPGTIDVIASDTTNKPKAKDRFVPRLSADIGLNFAVAKVDLNALLYPQTKTAAIGLSLGVVW
ncbi:MAG TPA: hypothetical protein PKK43_00120 [Spirochaetota bacterium]|nr:hypothetical protein [Spirochaetota bacterium]